MWESLTLKEHQISSSFSFLNAADDFGGGGGLAGSAGVGVGGGVGGAATGGESPKNAGSSQSAAAAAAAAAAASFWPTTVTGKFQQNSFDYQGKFFMCVLKAYLHWPKTHVRFWG